MFHRSHLFRAVRVAIGRALAVVANCGNPKPENLRVALQCGGMYAHESRRSGFHVPQIPACSRRIVIRSRKVWKRTENAPKYPQDVLPILFDDGSDCDDFFGSAKTFFTVSLNCWRIRAPNSFNLTMPAATVSEYCTAVYTSCRWFKSAPWHIRIKV